MNIEEFSTSISFTTPSDALFTAFFVKYARTIPLELFDDLLSLFHHVRFDSSTVTMRRSEDIMEHIVGQRGAKADYPHKRGHEQSSKLVAELVAEYLDSQRAAFHQMLYDDVGYTLQQMTLVCRSWADAVLRYSQRCVHIKYQRQLRMISQSPSISPWVRWLTFKGEVKTRTMDMDTKEMPRLLLGILKRCSNLTHLRLANYRLTAAPIEDGHIPNEKEEEEFMLAKKYLTPYDIIRQLGEMNRLESLWLQHPHHVSTSTDPDLWKLCAVLPRMRSLKSLCLENWDSRLPAREANTKSQDVFSLADVTSPPPSLKQLSLIRIGVVDPAPLDWLLKSRNGYDCTSLELSLDDMFRSSTPSLVDKAIHN